ncbi:MAG: SDR family NAD(P)-dependent oxidoreductase [Rhodospirillales bacterium]
MSGRTLLVTGAGGGVGGALVARALDAGWRVIAGRRDPEEAPGPRTDPDDRVSRLRIDLADPQGVGAAVDACPVEEVTALVLCASPPPPVRSFTRTTAADLRDQLAVAAVGNHALLAAVWRRWFRPAGGGHVLAVLSSALGPPVSATTAALMASYVTAKGALAALMAAAVAELGRAGLRASVIAPGHVETGMLAAFDPLILERARAATPDGRFLEPGAVAAAILAALDDPPPPGRLHQIPLPERAETR